MKKTNILLLLIFILSIILASVNIKYPGIYYDEILFGNAAVGGSSTNFIHHRIFGIPFLLMPYIGALKAYIYFPIFHFFPVDAWSIRIPSIILGLTGGLLLVYSIWIWFGRRTAIIAALFTFLDPVLLIHSRLDWGPTSLMFLCRGLLLFGLSVWWKNQKSIGLWIAIAATLLGLFDKLNFVWIACSAWLMFVVFFRKNIQEYFKRNHCVSLIQGILLVLVLVSFLLRALLVGASLETSSISSLERTKIGFNLIYITLIGGGPLDVICGNGTIPSQWMVPAYILAIVSCFPALVFGLRGFLWREWLFISCFTALLSLAFLATKTATGPHHSAVLANLTAILLVPLLSYPINSSNLIVLKGILFLRTMSVCVLCFAMIFTTLYVIRTLKFPINSNWDIAHNDLKYLCHKYPNSSFRTGDWGMGTQLIAFSKAKLNINDNWPEFLEPKNKNSDFFVGGKSKDTILLLRHKGRENFPKANANARYAMENCGFPFQLIKVYNDCYGKPLIEAWLIQHGNR